MCEIVRFVLTNTGEAKIKYVLLSVVVSLTVTVV